MSEITDKASRFLRSFEQNGHFKYRERAATMVITNSKSMVIDYDDLLNYDVELANKVLEVPKDTIPHFRSAVYSVLEAENAAYANQIKEDFNVRFKGIPTTPLRKINVDYLNKMFAFNGVVVRVSERKNILIEGVFECQLGHTQSVPQDSDVLTKPKMCDSYHDKTDKPVWRLLLDQSEFADYQLVRVQETSDEMPPGQLPRGFDVIMKNDLVDVLRPGDHATIVGTMGVVRDASAPKNRGKVFDSDIDCNYAEARDKDTELVTISKDDIEEFKKIREQPDIYSRLVQSVAPSVLGYTHVKEALLLQQVGGNTIILPDGSKRRGDSHILLVGDPALAKSEMLLFASRLAQRSVTASGRGSSAAGLSAGIIKINEISMLEAGVLPLADKGLACIDELDKMRAEDRSSLHEAMEAETITISKAGFHTILNARTSILAALNPKMGSYDPQLPFMENISLPPPLVSRFDLIFVVRDQPDKTEDEKLARFMLSLHETEKFDISPPIEFDTLKKYIAYAKRLKPEFTREASDVIVKFFKELRSMAEPGNVPVTPRTIESLVRLSTARAKLMLKEQVTTEDAEVAVRLMRRMIEDTALNPTTGKFDSSVFTGTSSEQISKTKIVAKVLEEIRKSDSGIISKSDLKSRLMAGGLTTEEAETMIRRLMGAEGKIYETKPGLFKLVY